MASSWTTTPDFNTMACQVAVVSVGDLGAPHEAAARFKGAHVPFCGTPNKDSGQWSLREGARPGDKVLCPALQESRLLTISAQDYPP